MAASMLALDCQFLKIFTYGTYYQRLMGGHRHREDAYGIQQDRITW